MSNGQQDKYGRMFSQGPSMTPTDPPTAPPTPRPKITFSGGASSTGGFGLGGAQHGIGGAESLGAVTNY